MLSYAVLQQIWVLRVTQGDEMIVRFLAEFRRWSGLINVVWGLGTILSLWVVFPYTYVYATQAGFGTVLAALVTIPAFFTLFAVEALIGVYVLCPLLDPTLDIWGHADFHYHFVGDEDDMF